MTKQRQEFETKLKEIVNQKLIAPRAFQSRIGTKVNEGWHRGMVSQLIVSPTGSGKTVMGLMSCRDYVEEIGPQLHGCSPQDIGVCWVAMRRNLLAQAEVANWELFDGNRNENVLCRNVEYVSMFDRQDVVARFSQYKHIYMVVDEAHHDAAATMVHLHSIIKPDRVLGLSATPQRSDSFKLCFQHEIHDAGYHFLIQDGYLSKFNQWIMQEWTPESVARLYLKNDCWGKSLAFFLAREECEAFAAYIRNPKSLGINNPPKRVEVVHGGSNRTKQLEHFEKGDIDILVSMSVLTEGFDCPSLKTVFVRDAKSKGVTMQMSGRVLRIWENNGIPVVKNIVQSKNARYPFTRFARAHTQFVEGETGRWATVEANDRVNKMTHIMTHKMATSKAPVLPKFFTEKKKKWSPTRDQS